MSVTDHDAPGRLISMVELLKFQEKMRDLGIYFIDPDYCGYPGWGLRFKTDICA